MDIIKQIEQIEEKWQKMMKTAEQEISKARKMNIRVDDDEAYLKCCKLLEQQFDQEYNNSNRFQRSVKVGIKKVEEHIELCKQQRIIKSNEKKQLEEQIKELEIQLSKINKRKSKQDLLHESIEDFHFNIEENNKKLQECKQKSYEQKSVYLQLQLIQKNFLAEISNLEESEKEHYQSKKRQQKYKELKKIKDKLFDKSNYIDNDIQNYLKEKINVMSTLRTNLITIEETLDQYDSKIQEQNYIIEGLKDKAEQIQDVDQEIYRKYQSKYEDLYFNDRNNVNNWRNYKSYLEELLNKNKVKYNPYYNEDDQQQEQKKLNKNIKTQPNIFYVQDKEDSPTFSYIKTPPKRESRISKQPLSHDNIRLPMIYKMSGKNDSRIKQTLKNNLKKMMNQSDISLESIDSKDQNTSGQFLEVQFHKK